MNFSATFLKEVNKQSGEDVQLCFQCFKCSLGCPVSFAMDYLPHEIMRFVQMGLKEKVLNSSTIWVCTACETCTTRCPNKIDIAKIIDTLRQISLEEDRVAEKKVVAFHKAFLGSVRRHGKLNELEMMISYKLRTGRFLDDLWLAPQLLKRKKLPLKLRHISNKAQIKEMFKKAALWKG
jgi:heterodisulfide reductase subunit C